MEPRRLGRTRRGQAGSVLLETVITILIMTVAGVSLIALVQSQMALVLKSRERVTCGRVAQGAFARLKTINYYSLFASDSGSANHGLWSAYPYRAVLDGIKTTAAASKYDRFRVGVVFMRRDASDANANGMTSDLIEFTDANNNGIDDFDSNIRYFNQNGDGDFYDTFTSNGRTVAEHPDTHLKKVTVDVFRRGRLVCSQTELVALEQWTGDPNPSSEAVLSLQLSTPPNNAFLYRQFTPSQVGARALVISQAYPAAIDQLRADTISRLQLSGETDPLATVRFYVGGSGVLATTVADSVGQFSSNPSAVTTALVEGGNTLAVQAVKDGYTSPITRRDVILDIEPPSAAGATPTGTANTLAPYVAATLSDSGISTTTSSGLCLDVVAMRINGSTVSYSYDAATGRIVWIDSMTNTVPVLPEGAYTALVEAGDYAGYKATQSWTFTLSVGGTDHSAPSVANKSPIGMAPSQWPLISVRVFDEQSGIVPSSIRLLLDGEVVVDAANVSGHYDASDGTVSFMPPGPFDPGSGHTARVEVSHFAADPADKVTSIEDWAFSVP